MKKKDHSSRRNFLKLSSLAGLGLSTTIFSSYKSEQLKETKKEIGKLNESSKRLLKLFNLKYPFFQAAPGGEKLAIAVANAGCMGSIQLAWKKPEDAYEIIKRLNNETKGNYYANYVLHRGTKSLDKALEAGCKNFQFSWGTPEKSIVDKIRNAEGTLGIQVTSPLNTKKALEHSPDFLICQGIEAGGHVQGTSYVKDILHEIIETAGSVPVLVSGGISTGHDIRNVINMGAAGAVMGTRLIATIESDISDFYRQKLVEAQENSTVYTNCFSDKWNAMTRVLRNSTFLNWEAAGCPLLGNKPGEGDVIGKKENGKDIYRYSTAGPFEGATGNLEAMIMYAGKGVDKINDIPSAAELLERLCKEFENR
ncbi:NAD(P)H-dependent flavin oxidoreductase [Cognatitamlana onchidii]|uniref:NAD(P)H-dependent flavin oxidoreductase n=1 Tax=Cognatitamlana onchidii TaxID=2562860 RepID=UPI0010A6984A|nr:nitronate monooxygenase [Algibacter onchidii]